MSRALWASLRHDSIAEFKLQWTLEAEEDELRTTHWGFVHHAVCDGRLKCLRYMLESGLDPNLKTRVEQNTPLAVSIINRDFSSHSNPVHMLLLRYGGNPFLCNIKGADAFHVPTLIDLGLSHFEAYLVVDLVCGEADSIPIDLWRVVKPFIYKV